MIRTLPKSLKVFAGILCCCTLLFTSCKPVSKYAQQEEEEEKDGPAEIARMDFEMMRDPALNTVPYDRIQTAFEYKQQLISQPNFSAIPNVNWQSFGPKNQGGRTRTMIILTNDASGNTALAGSVAGGLWKTTNLNATEPNWLPVNDLLSNLAITSLIQDPTNSQVIYMATGEGYFNSDAVRGLGIFKSTDGGSTFTQITNTNNANFYYTQKLDINSSGVLFAATRNGLFRSPDGGGTFTKVLGTGLGISGASSNICYDVKVSPAGEVYASLDGSLHKSTNGGQTFNSAITLPIGASRIEIACAASDNNYVYLLVELNNVVEGILQSTDAGATFVAKTEPTDADTGIPAADFSRTQAWYDLTICVDPNNPSTLLVGGVDAFKSINGGNSWQQMTHWYAGFGYQYMHADQHYFFYKPGSSSIAYFANDGGIFMSNNMTAAIPTIIDKGTNYVTAQFYACAIDPTAGKYYFLAGAQDNGSHKFTTSGIQNTTQPTGGDGAYCHIDQNQPQFQITSYVYNNYYRSNNGGSSFTSVSNGNTGRFINPTDYDDADNKLYAAKGTSEYLVWTNPQTGNTFVTKSQPVLSGQVSAVTVSPNTALRVFFGTSNGRVVKIDDAAGITPVATYIGAGLPGSYITCIEVEKGNDDHILVTYSNYGVNSIWETTNGGVNWSSIEGNLPDMPVRWALLNPTNNKQVLIATELGVWSTDNTNGTSTVWGATNSGLANVRVDMLQLRASDNYVIAATHGRGLFGTDAFTQPTAGFSAINKVGYTGTPIQFQSNSFKDVSWAWNFGDGTTSTLKNPTHAYTAPGFYKITLSINGGASSISIDNYIQILPNKALPYTLTDGGNFETNTADFGANLISGTKFELGNSAISGKSGTHSGNNAWVTGLTAVNYADNMESQLWTPNYNFTAGSTFQLSFWAKFQTEVNYDGFRIEYSIDRGITWLPVGTTTAPNWYNFANTAENTSFPKNQAFFAGSFGTSYVQYSRDVSFLAGNASVAFRVNFKSDENTNGPGAAIDDFEVSGPPLPPPPPPFAITSFTAGLVQNDITLSWSTVNESGLNRFGIMRGTDSITMTDIGFKAATNMAANSYTYVDNIASISPRPTRLYYKLRVEPVSGTNTFSKAIFVDIPALPPPPPPPPTGGGVFTLGPNPFTSFLSIQNAGNVKGIALYSIDGKLIQTTKTFTGSIYYINPALPKGVYIIRIITDRETIVKQIIK